MRGLKLEFVFIFRHPTISNDAEIVILINFFLLKKPKDINNQHKAWTSKKEKAEKHIIQGGTARTSKKENAKKHILQGGTARTSKNENA